MDSCDADPHAGTCAVKPAFKIKSESSLLDFLDPTLLEDDETLADIRKSVRNGQLVVIRDAFIPEFAEHVWKQLDRDDLDWKRRSYIPQLELVPGHLSCKHALDKSSYSTELLEVMDMLNNQKTKAFMETLSGRNCSGPTGNIAPTWYKPGEYSSPHTDFTFMRSFTFLWNLSKDWDPSWGGAFHWSPAGNMEDGYHYPTFNTLLLFLPTPTSVHMVTPVEKNAKGKRLVLGGSFVAGGGEDAFTTQDPIEDIYIHEKDHNQLNADAAAWIAHDMDVDKITKDPIRKQKLLGLREAIANEYLYPLDKSTHVIESYEEDDSTMNATLGQRVDTVEPVFNITSESSILDYLDPTLLEDDETLANVRKSLLDGQLVVIRDAFIPEFAEYVWKQLDRDDLNWTRMVHKSNSQHTAGHISSKHRLPDTSTELLEVMDMLINTKTKDFMEAISGRGCSSPIRKIAPSLYKPGDYSAPHTDFHGWRSVTFLWNLSKDWDPSWGGAFYWGPSKTVEDGYYYPTFNTLQLFLPTPSSVHAVTPVTDNAKGKRLLLGGWYTAGGGEKDNVLSSQDPVEDIYIHKEDHIRLTAQEAVGIAHYMDVDKITKDPSRKKKLLGLSEAIANEYLYPLDKNTLIIESSDEEEQG
jgi:Rps23 Pro-64 3,4-dihydroxylase Tpa1-like proline 4-hydroxylase